VPNLISVGLFCHTQAAEGRKFCHFWTLAFRAVANCWHTEKVECGCTTTNLPLLNGIKIVFVLQCFKGKIMRTNSIVHKRDIASVTDKQTKRQTENSMFLVAMVVGKV